MSEVKPGPFMHALLCDDVRREEGGKLSIMGIYNRDLLLLAFPATLPKLCLVMSVFLPGDWKQPESLTFRLMIDDLLVNEVAIDDEVLAQFEKFKAELTEPLESQRMTYTTVMQLAPVHFGSACEIKARAICDGQEFKGGRWKVRTVDQATSAGISSRRNIPGTKTA